MIGVPLVDAVQDEAEGSLCTLLFNFLDLFLQPALVCLGEILCAYDGVKGFVKRLEDAAKVLDKPRLHNNSHQSLDIKCPKRRKYTSAACQTLSEDNRTNQRHDSGSAVIPTG